MSNFVPPSRSKMYSVVVFEGDQDFPFSGELEDGFEYHLYRKSAWHTGPVLMDAVANMMSLASLNAVARSVPYLVLTVVRLDGKDDMWDELTTVAQWLWKLEDQTWEPYATGGPHPIHAPPF